MTAPHLAETHIQYPDGFPPRTNDSLLGHWETPRGIVVVERHPHGYEVHFYPCYQEHCDGCSPTRGSSNPHTMDGHDFRACRDHGPIVTVAGGVTGYLAVLEYLAIEGSLPHVLELADLQVEEAELERAFRKAEQEENERQMAEQDAQMPTLEERLAAVQAELAALEAQIRR